MDQTGFLPLDVGASIILSGISVFSRGRGTKDKDSICYKFKQEGPEPTLSSVRLVSEGVGERVVSPPYSAPLDHSSRCGFR